MGGKAFSRGPDPLNVPRLPPVLYERLLNHYVALLKQYFSRVASPMPGPGKTSHGDIDILVTSPHSSKQSVGQLPSILKAHRQLDHSFAVAHPQVSNAFVQLDVSYIPEDKFDWHLFHHAHGDIWNLLGTSLRPFGLTPNDSGLGLRIREIEQIDRKKSFLLLTNEPEEVIRLLGLDPERYEQGFDSVEDMYRYVMGMRWFRKGCYIKTDLKSNDRKRMHHREVYRSFVEEWIPSIVGAGGEEAPEEMLAARERVRVEVLDRFGKWRSYEKRLSDWQRARNELAAKQLANIERGAMIQAEIAYAEAWIEFEIASGRVSLDGKVAKAFLA